MPYMMAEISDGMNTVVFTESSVYEVTDVKAPAPEREHIEGAAGSIMGTDLLGATWENREVTADLRIRGTSGIDLQQRVEMIRSILVTAERYAFEPNAPRVEFRWRPSDVPYWTIADVLDGDLTAIDFREGLASSYADVLRLSHFKPEFELYLIARPQLRGSLRTVVTTQIAAHKPYGITHRYVHDGSVLGTVNLAGRVDGPMWANAKSGTGTATPAVGASGGRILLGDDYTGAADRRTEVVFGIEKPISYGVTAPGFIVEYSTGAGTWAPVAGLRLYSDQYPEGLSVTNDGASGRLVEAFNSPGEKEIRFDDPGVGWALATYNANARWISIRYATAGSAVVWPNLNYGPFRNSRSLIKVPGSLVNGDTMGRCIVQVKQPGAEALRQVRMGQWINWRRKNRGIPPYRHQGEYTTNPTAGQAAISNASPRRSGSEFLSVGGSGTNYEAQFTGDGAGSYTFTRTGAIPGSTEKHWSIDFWLTFIDSSGNPVEPPDDPTPIYRIWDDAAGGGGKILALIIEDKKLRVLLSKDGSTVIKFSKPSGRSEKKKGRLESKAQFQAGKRYLCRVNRRNKRIDILVGANKFSEASFKTVDKANADTLGLGATYAGGTSVPIIGNPVGGVTGWDVTDSKDGNSPLQPCHFRIDQFRWRVGQEAGKDTKFLKDGLSSVPAAEASITRGLYLFNESGGNANVANNASGAPAMSAGTATATGIAKIPGAADPQKFEGLKTNLPLSGSLFEYWPGSYKPIALVRSSANNPANHSMRLSHDGYHITPHKVSPLEAGIWTPLDLGELTCEAPPLGYSMIAQSAGASVDPQDPANWVGVQVEGKNENVSTFDVDEVLMFPLDCAYEGSYAFYDTGPTTANRAIGQNEFMRYDGTLDEPYWGQQDAGGRLQRNFDADGWGDEFYLAPGRDAWFAIDAVKYQSSGGKKLEADAAVTLEVTVTVEPRFIELSGQYA